MFKSLAMAFLEGGFDNERKRGLYPPYFAPVFKYNPMSLSAFLLYKLWQNDLIYEAVRPGK